MENLAVVILAAGQGTRMKSKLPKVLHPVAGLPMIQYSLNSAKALSDRRPVMVIGHGAEMIRAALGAEAEYVYQAERLGTGHALLQARQAVEGQAAQVLSLYGDMPLLTLDTLRQLVERQRHSGATVTMLTCLSDDSMAFGRVIRDGEGRILQVVEEVDCTPEQKRIKELNCGIYCWRADWLWPNLPKIGLSRKGEYYLTDMIEMAVRDGQQVESIVLDDVRQVIGINKRTQLAWGEKVLRDRIREALMDAGVTMIDPETVYVDATVQIAPDTTIYPNCHLQGHTQIGEDCVIGPNTIIRDSRIGQGCRIQASVVEEAVIEDEVTMGPFAHVRPGAHLEQGVHMGNFGEVKNSHIGAGTMISHFSYIGDATVGEKVNIGAGAVTCNYDGKTKHATIIDDGAFIGSGAKLVAPLHVGQGAIVGAGAVVTHDVPPQTVVYGVPAREKGQASS